MEKCPCHSGKGYEQCCKPFHEGALPAKAVELMRSRYSAYALGLADYIQRTTHETSPHKNREKNEILTFCQETRFDFLKIIEEIENGEEAFVTFRASLTQNGRDVSFTEKSLFYRVKGQWLYHSGCYQ